MYAIVRHTPYDAGKLIDAQPELAEFQRIHAAQPGHAGNLVI